jgi:hypothetical protein
MEKQCIPVNAPPIGTSLPPDYKRGLSNVSLKWTDNSRPNTPVDIICAILSVKIKTYAILYFFLFSMKFLEL